MDFDWQFFRFDPLKCSVLSWLKSEKVLGFEVFSVKEQIFCQICVDKVNFSSNFVLYDKHLNIAKL